MIMGDRPHFKCILLALVLPVVATQATIVRNKFKRLDSGQNITGEIGAELKVRSRLECAFRCRKENECGVYQYKGNNHAPNCIFIYIKCGGPDGQVIQHTDSSTFYQKEVLRTKPGPTFYENFDDSNGLVFWEGTTQKTFVPLVSGKINSAVITDYTKKQWVDLGIHLEACMTRPETCGAAGGTVSVWINVIDDESGIGGIISSDFDKSSGFLIFLTLSAFCSRLRIILPDGFFHVYYSVPSGWTHILINYIGPNNGEGIMTYYNGGEVKCDTTKNVKSLSAGDGRIVVGRRYSGRAGNYKSVQVDELILFNQTLTMDETRALAAAT